MQKMLYRLKKPSSILLLVTFLIIGYLTLPVSAQIPEQVTVEDAWRVIYQQLPDLPLENNYVSKEKGKPASDDTLISRLIRYHLFVKGRPPMYRFDWKITLAEYLGVSPDLMEENVYPGQDTLKTNPMEGDRAAINRLTRQQRNNLIQNLVNIFGGNISSQSNNPNSQSGNNREDSNPNLPPQAQPGDAKLLIP